MRKTIIFIYLIILAFCLYFNRLDDNTLHFDACCFGQVAKEMVMSGNYVIPKAGGEVFFDNKPPLFMWLLAISGKIFGFKNFSMRLPSSIFAFLSIIVLFFYVNKIFSDIKLAFLSSFILLFTQQFIFYARSATMETLYGLLLFLSIVMFWYGYYYNKVYGFYLMGIFVGFAVMVRSLTGLLPYFIVFVYILFVKKTKETLLNIHFWIGVMLSLIISLPWHVYMLLTFGEKFFDAYFAIFYRYFFEQKKLWYEYFRNILSYYWPWFPFLCIGIYYEIKKFLHNKQVLSEQFTGLILFYILILFILLNVSKYKYPQHLVPLYFHFAIFSAKGLLKYDKNKNYIFTKIFFAIGTLYVAAFMLFSAVPKSIDTKEYNHTLDVFEYLKNKNVKIYVLADHDYWHYYWGCLFYCDKKVYPVNIADVNEIKDGFLLVKKKHLMDIRKHNFEKSFETQQDILFIIK